MQGVKELDSIRGPAALAIVFYHFHRIKFGRPGSAIDDYAARHGLGTHFVHDLAQVVVTFAVASLSYRFVERPSLSLEGLFPCPAAGVRPVERPRLWAPAASPEAG